MGRGAERHEHPRDFKRAEILLNLIAVTILANPETLDVAKKDNIHT